MPDNMEVAMTLAILLSFVLQSGSVFSENVLPTFQAQYSWPLRLGGEIGANFYRSAGFLIAAGPFVSASAGRDGATLNAGVKGSLFAFLPYSTGGVAASGLYLWDDPDAMYAGARVSSSFSLVSVFGGVYRRVSGEDRDDWLLSLGAGLGMP